MTGLVPEMLVDALRAATVPLTSEHVPGTGFRVAPDLIVTCAHVVDEHVTSVRVGADGEAVVVPGSRHAEADLVLLRTTVSGPHVLLAEPVLPGDDLWTFGYPVGDYRQGDSVFLRSDGPTERTDGTRLLKATDGRVGRGHSGAPVLNCRTGAVCGVVAARGTTTPTARLVPVSTLFAHYPRLRGERSGDWLSLLDDGRLRACGLRWPGPRLRAYLDDVGKADHESPYAGLLGTSTPLHQVYQHQQVTPAGDADRGADPVRLPADEVFARQFGAQIIGSPGAGKSSLLRHVAANLAACWLDGRQAHAVPLPIHADALAAGGGLTELLAAGFQGFLHTTMDRATLVALFGAEPLPGLPWLVLVDGLDEILEPQIRDHVIAKIGQHRQDPRYRFALATRPLRSPALAKLAQADDFPTYVLEPFESGQLALLARDWLRELNSPDPERAASRFVSRLDSTKLGELARTPLIATMLCIVYGTDPEATLPFNRVQLYRRFIHDLLLAKHRTPLGNVRDRLRDWVGRSGATAEQAAEHLLEHLPDLLRGLAFTRRGLNRYPGTPGGFDVPPWRWQEPARPPTLSTQEWARVKSEVLRASGVVTESRTGGGFQFIHRSIEEYLAAELVVAHHPDPNSRSARHLLAPQTKWPWQEKEVRTFVAALWVEGPEDPAKPLLRLLSRRNRRVNLWFVLDLHLQGIRLPGRVGELLADILAENLTDPRLTNGEWAASARALRSLDEQRTAAALEDALQHGRISSYLRREAATLLAGLDRDAGTRWLTRFAQTHDDKVERLRAAKALHELDGPAGIEVLAELAADQRMADLRVEAADLVYRSDPDRGEDLLQLVVDVRSADHRVSLRAARVLAGHDRARGLTALTALATNPDLDAQVRFDAALTSESCSPGVRSQLMLGLADNRETPVELRTEAAVTAGEDGHPGGVRALVDLVREKKVDAPDKAVVAQAIARLDPAVSVRVLLELTVDPAMGRHAVTAGRHAGQGGARTAATEALCRLSRLDEVTDDVRLDAAVAASELDPDTGGDAVRDLTVGGVSASTMVRAAKALAGLDRRDEAVDLLAAMADVADRRGWKPNDRLRAGVALGELDPARGREVLPALVRSMPPRNRVSAALEVVRLDRAAGISLLDQTAHTSTNPDSVRIDATRALERLSRERALRRWETLAGPSELGPVARRTAQHAVSRLGGRPELGTPEPIDRLKAARAQLTRRGRVAAYLDIAKDTAATDTTRMDALEHAAKLGSGSAVDLARALSEDRSLSRTERKRAEQIAGRYG